MNIKELKAIVKDVLAEAKKKKKAESKPSQPSEYKTDKNFDFSAPLGQYNLYKSQGAVNWGPMTSPGTSIDTDINKSTSAKNSKEDRDFIHGVVGESLIPEATVWKESKEKTSFANIWEVALHVIPEELLEKKVSKKKKVESDNSKNKKK